jgi:uncharacterized protein YqeY
MLKDRLQSDLKTAMLARDSFVVDTLRTVKGAILNEEVAKNLRETGLDDESLESLLTKEVKKRHEAAELFDKGGNHESADKERREAVLLQAYLPDQLDDDALRAFVAETVAELGATTMQQMGQVIGAVKQKVGNSGDGAKIAQFVKERLS